MALIGVRYSAFSPITSLVEGSPIEYGNGREVGMDISVNVSITRNSTVLNANDVIAEEDNSISEAQITVNLDDLTLENEAFICGTLEQTTGTGEGATKHYQDTDAPAPLGGYGYVRVRQKTNQTTGVTVRTFIATWWYKVRARIETEENQTKGQNKEFRTPTVIMRAMGSIIDNSEYIKFRDRQEFSTYAAAKAFIDNYANITA